MEAVSREIVGREAELDNLARFVDALPGRPGILLLEGAAGIGKTTLWDAAVALARRAGHRVLVSRPLEAEADLSFTGLGDLLDEVLDDTLPHLPRPQRSALEVALLRSEGGSTHSDGRAVGVAVLGVLRVLGTSSPVLVAVDDVHWLDVPSARALQFAVHRLADEPVGVLLSSRTTERKPFEVERLVPEDRVTRIDVQPVSSGALARLVRARVAARFTRATLLRLHAASGGNPFFALEIARALERQGVEPGRQDPLPIPNNLTELVRDRLSLLPARTRQALLVASAAASPTTALVAEVSGDGQAHSALGPALDAGIVELVGDRVAFTHPLLVSVVYGNASQEERQEAHAGLADAVSDLEERAAHLARAARGPDRDVATALDAAAAAARMRGAPETAADLAEQACLLTPPEDRDEAGRRQIDAAEQHLRAGDLVRSRAVAEHAIATLSPGPVRARGLVVLALTQAHAARRWEQSYATMEQALREVGDDDGLRAEITRQLAWSYAASHRPARAEPHAPVALELAARLGDRVLLAESLTACADVEFQRGRGLRRDLIQRALALGTTHEHRYFFRHPHWAIWRLCRWNGDYRGARSSLETLLRIANERGEENATPWLLWALSTVEIEVGAWEAALRLIDEAHALAVDTGQETPRQNALESRAKVEAHRGDVEEARAHGEQSLAAAVDAIDRIDAAMTFGFIELSLGKADAATRYLTPLIHDARREGVEDPSIYPFWPDAIEALIACGELQRAEPVLEWLEERGRTLERPWALATAGRCRALLFAARGDVARALVCIDEALRAHQDVAQTFQLGRTLLVKGKILRRAKQKRPAREAIEQALEIFDRLGAALWSKQAHDELGRIGGRAPSRGELTPTELRVAGLVAEGQTNRDVAAALYVSENTVESHLTHIYAKLGVHSRTELARRFAAESASRTHSS